METNPQRIHIIKTYIADARARGYSDEQIYVALRRSRIDYKTISVLLGKTFKRPFYKTWWFLSLLMVVLLVGLIFAGTALMNMFDDASETPLISSDDEYEDYDDYESDSDLGSYDYESTDYTTTEEDDSSGGAEAVCGDGVCYIGEDCVEDCGCDDDNDCEDGYGCDLDSGSETYLECIEETSTSTGGSGADPSGEETGTSAGDDGTSACVSDSECGDLVCDTTTGTCVETCVVDTADCYPYFCNSSTLICEDDCTIDSDCISGTCEEGVCVPDVCYNLVDDDSDGQVDYYGGCDVDADGQMDWICGCDVDADGYLIYGEYMELDSCDTSLYSYGCYDFDEVLSGVTTINYTFTCDTSLGYVSYSPDSDCFDYGVEEVGCTDVGCDEGYECDIDSGDCVLLEEEILSCTIDSDCLPYGCNTETSTCETSCETIPCEEAYFCTDDFECVECIDDTVCSSGEICLNSICAEGSRDLLPYGVSISEINGLREVLFNVEILNSDAPVSGDIVSELTVYSDDGTELSICGDSITEMDSAEIYSFPYCEIDLYDAVVGETTPIMFNVDYNLEVDTLDSIVENLEDNNELAGEFKFVYDGVTLYAGFDLSCAEDSDCDSGYECDLDSTSETYLECVSWEVIYGEELTACSDDVDCETDQVCVSFLCYDAECTDGIDNDGDGAIDYPSDLGCDSSGDDSEDSDGTSAGPYAAAELEQGFFGKIWNSITSFFGRLF